MSESVLDVVPPHGATKALALVLHGGRAKSTQPVRARNLTVVRMGPFANALRRKGDAHGLAVARLRYGVRGWNGPLRSPLADVRAAIDQLAAEHPGVPIALVGHSMGGRSALYEGTRPLVQAIVALAPWIEQGDPYEQLRGQRLLVAHGTRDRTTSPVASAALVEALQGVAESATFVAVHRDGHGMLRRASLWHELAAAYVLATLCDVAPDESVPLDAANVVEKALAGRPHLDV